MTTQEALQYFETHGIDGLSIEDMDKICLYWLENPSKYASNISEDIVFYSFGHYDLIKQEEYTGNETLTCRHIYYNLRLLKWYCLQFEEDRYTGERWDFEWYEVYPERRTIVEYHRKDVMK